MLNNNKELGKNNLPKAGVLLYTYNRVDDAKINMEIIRNVWCGCDLFKNITIVHSFNGKKEWWSEKYLEDELINTENPGHFAGAEMLINEGIKVFTKKYPDIDYVVILASDTWLVLPEYIKKNIMIMEKEGKYLTACAWGTRNDSDFFKTGMSLDFNIVNIKWANKNKLFPIHYDDFLNKYSELFLYNNLIIYLERVFALRFKQAVMRSAAISSENILNDVACRYVNQIKEREPVNSKHKLLFKKQYVIKRRMYWKDMGLLTHHEALPKQKALRKWGLNLGKYGQYFLAARNLDYYNNESN